MYIKRCMYICGSHIHIIYVYIYIYRYSFANVVHLALVGGPMCVFHDKDTSLLLTHQDLESEKSPSDFQYDSSFFGRSLLVGFRVSNFPEDRLPIILQRIVLHSW